jgi:hypothetical protein
VPRTNVPQRTHVTLSATTPFTINGTLKTADDTPIAGATITLQNPTNTTSWNNVTTNVTDANGTYEFSNNESAVGTYFYRTAYDGNATYANSTSNVVSVTAAQTKVTLTASTPPSANRPPQPPP